MVGPSPVRLRLVAHHAWRTDCATRLPFRFGIHTMTEAPLALLQVEVETTNGERARGWAGELMVPRWFDKNPAKSIEEERAALLFALRDALQVAEEGGPRTVFEHGQDMWTACGVPAGRAGGLLAGFGTSLVERALLDALCRLLGRSFHDLLHGGVTGLDAAALHPSLAGRKPAELLPGAPLDSVAVRHTIGLVDALEEDDLEGRTRVDDGLPETLVEDIRHYGFTHFKVKLGGASAADRERLLRVARLVAREVPEGARWTLDGNEQFQDLAALVGVLESLRGDPAGDAFLTGLLSIEQPLARARTFESAPNVAMETLSAFAPVIIDEADGDPRAFEDALALGYRGVSYKNCKGVLRGVAAGMLCRSRGGLLQSAEDLTNLPLFPLQQDLCAVAALGLGHVERNGHHYFRGLDHLPVADREAALVAHPDLYARRADGGAALRIEDGRLALGSLQCPGFGVAVTPVVDDLTPLFPA